jgi:hypothetical protein
MAPADVGTQLGTPEAFQQSHKYELYARLLVHCSQQDSQHVMHGRMRAHTHPTRTTASTTPGKKASVIPP